MKKVTIVFVLYLLICLLACSISYAQGEPPVPVKLIGMSGERQNETVILRWSTASELNNDHFTVQTSSDGIEWQTLATIKGMGTTRHTYNYTFETVMLPRMYYRLFQTDYDGTTEELKIIVVEGIGNYTVRYYDLSGREVAEDTPGAKIKIVDQRFIYKVVKTK